MKIESGKYYIVRGRVSGVFFGKIARQEGQEVTMNEVRNIWYWEGASSVLQLALDGVSNPQNCKFTVWLDELTITDAAEIIPCTDKASDIIKAVKEWKC